MRTARSGDAITGFTGPPFDVFAAVAAAVAVPARILFEPARLNRLARQGLHDDTVPTVGEVVDALPRHTTADGPGEMTAAAIDALARIALESLHGGAPHAPARAALAEALTVGENWPSWTGPSLTAPSRIPPGPAPTVPPGTPL
ncbi:hypothetical protein [Streptomyces sp. NPDC047070]|uniref:hypothetical protein n=1 Tax=Streptomyces sp. NPDC047070 TaxID=3154923 RepID=UPI00345552F1